MKTIVQYKWFIGVTSQEELKKKYRSLALQYHPDRNNGQDNNFKEINAEYQYLIGQGTSIIFPIGIGTRVDDRPQFDPVDFSNWAEILQQKANQQREAFNRRRAEAQSRYNNNQRDFEKAQQDRIKYYFDQLRLKDNRFKKIDDIIETQQDKGYKPVWCLWETNKMENLTEDHFKYLQWKLGFREGWGKTMYQNYINSQVGW